MLKFVCLSSTGRGIHLPKDFRKESAINKPEPDHPNRQRDMRRSMLGFFAEQKTIAMGESQKQCRVEMQPEYRTSQSLYSPQYTGTTGAGLLPIPTVTPRSHTDQSYAGHYSRQYSAGNLVQIPVSPAHSESSSSQHSSQTSPLYEPDSPVGNIDPRLKAHTTKRAVAYTSTSQVDPRLARSMGAKAPKPAEPMMQQVPSKVPLARIDPQLAPGQVASGQPMQAKDKYSHLQESAAEYAKRKAAKSQKGKECC